MVTTMNPRTRYRKVSCLPCCGTGRELRTVNPAGNLVIGACWYCDGNGEVAVPVKSAPAPVCGDCRRPKIVFEGEAVCPTCVAYVPSDFE